MKRSSKDLGESSLNGTRKNLLDSLLDETRNHSEDLLDSLKIVADLANLSISASSSAVDDLGQRAKDIDMSADSSDMGVDGTNLSGEIAKVVAKVGVDLTKIVVMNVGDIAKIGDIHAKRTSGIKDSSLDSTEHVLKNVVNSLNTVTTNKTLISQGVNDSLRDVADKISMSELLVVGKSTFDCVGTSGSSGMANERVEILTDILVAKEVLNSVADMSIAAVMNDLRVAILDAANVVNVEASVLLGTTGMLLKSQKMLVVVNNSLGIAVGGSSVGEVTLHASGVKLIGHGEKDMLIDESAVTKLKRRSDGSKRKDAGRVSASRRGLNVLNLVGNNSILSDGSVLLRSGTSGDGRTKGSRGVVSSLGTHLRESGCSGNVAVTKVDGGSAATGGNAGGANAVVERAGSGGLVVERHLGQLGLHCVRSGSENWSGDANVRNC